MSVIGLGRPWFVVKSWTEINTDDIDIYSKLSKKHKNETTKI